MMNKLPDDIRRIISHSASTQGELRFGGDFSAWEELGRWEEIPRHAGLYMVGLKLGIQYGPAVSRIAYIGSTCNLRTRIQSHNARSHNPYLELLKLRYPNGFLVTWLALPGLSVEWLRALEDAALQEAKKQFGLYPVCNMNEVASPNVSQLANVVRIFPCDGLPFPCSLDSLSKHLSSKSLGCLRSLEPKAVNLPATKFAKQSIPNDWETWVTQEHVATWTLPKMLQLIEACKSLTLVPKQGKSKVVTFRAHLDRNPRPHTWGEVALVQARIIAEAWFPAERFWLKITCGKKLLGQAILDSKYYRGEDKSDLPQTRKRASIWQNKAWVKEAEMIHGQLPADYVPPTYEIGELPKAESASPFYLEHFRLLASSHALDAETIRQRIMWDREYALSLDRSRRLLEILHDRIEAKFQNAVRAECL